jgi:gluconolactonase
MRFGLLGMALVLAAQDFSQVQVEKALGGFRYVQGPMWSPAAKALLFCDVPENKVRAFLPGKGLASYRDNTNGAAAVAYDPQGNLVVAETRNRRVIRYFPGEEKQPVVVADRFEGKRFNAPNDLVVRKDGMIFFIDPAFGPQTDQRELDFHGVYRVNGRGELGLVLKMKSRPNGLALAQNGRTLYVTNADERRVLAIDVDGKGMLVGERVVLDKIEGVPDGLTLDEKGNLYVAAANVLIYSPQGRLLHTIFVSEKPSGVAFGDGDRMTLYITARTSVYRARMKVKGVVAESPGQ